VSAFSLGSGVVSFKVCCSNVKVVGFSFSKSAEPVRDCARAHPYEDVDAAAISEEAGDVASATPTIGVEHGEGVTVSTQVERASGSDCSKMLVQGRLTWSALESTAQATVKQVVIPNACTPVMMHERWVNVLLMQLTRDAPGRSVPLVRLEEGQFPAGEAAWRCMFPPCVEQIRQQKIVSPFWRRSASNDSVIIIETVQQSFKTNCPNERQSHAFPKESTDRSSCPKKVGRSLLTRKDKRWSASQTGNAAPSSLH
jgi:hypothetical protein